MVCRFVAVTSKVEAFAAEAFAQTFAADTFVRKNSKITFLSYLMEEVAQ